MMKYYYSATTHLTFLTFLFVTVGGKDKESSKEVSTPEALIQESKSLGRKDIIPDFESSSEELAAQQRPKRGYYYYGHPHSPNFFDRYFDRDDRAQKRRGQQNQSNSKRQSLGGKMLNKFRHRTNKLVDAASAVAFAHEKNNYNDLGDDSDVPDLETAGAFWNLFSSGGGGSSGRGYGHGGGGYGKGVNKSAVGLLGFLSLLSLIQSGLTTTTTAAPAGRRRRSVDNSSEVMEELPTSVDEAREMQNMKIAEIVLPLLTSFQYAVQDDKAAGHRLKCVLNEVCVCNHALATEFGEHGKDVGVMLMNVLESMAKKRQQHVVHQDHELLLKLKYAGRTGRNKKNCAKHYKKCQT